MENTNHKIIADKVFTNGQVYTVNEKNKWSEVVAIKDKKIIFVGSSKEIKNYIGNNTEVIDLNGKMMMPGFIESHCHPSLNTLNVLAVDLSKCTTIKEYQQVLKDYAHSNPDLEVIRGTGFLYTLFNSDGPKKEYIDEVISDKPVVVLSGDTHTCWLNSKALEICGINKDTPDPEGGEFVKDYNGNPTGYVKELPGWYFVEDRLPQFTMDDHINGISDFQSKANRSGITTVHDADINSPLVYDVYKQMVKNDQLTMRTRLSGAVYPDGSKGTIDEQFEMHLAENKRGIGDMLKTNTLKLYMDGVAETYTALIEEPYSDREEYIGEPLWDIDAFNEMCKRADKENLQIHVHSIGDRSTRYVLDAFEYVQKHNGKRDSRHMIAHVQLVNESDFDRFHELRVIAVPSPIWFEKEAYYYDIELKCLGQERTDREYPMKTFFDKDIIVASGSDAPVEINPMDVDVFFAPLIAIQHGITRCCLTKDPNNIENVLNPDERVSLEEMIKTFTINGAYANFLDDITGSIEEGKYADLIVLDKNIFDVPINEIYKTKILLTLLEGKEVYCDSQFCRNYHK